MKIKKILLAVTSFFVSFFFCSLFLNATDYNNGDIIDESITLGDTTAGNVQITKEVTKINDSGQYSIEFKVSGKDTTKKKIHVVVLFDRSGSMLCGSGTLALSSSVPLYAYIYNNQKLNCLNFFETPNSTKWESAVSGAINFSRSLLDTVPSAKLSLLPFGNSAGTGTDFESLEFSTTQFTYPNGGSNLDSAIENARTKLNSITDSKAFKYIIIISDGRPSDIGDAIDAADEAKTDGIKIYSIGYETDDTTAKNTLKTISSNDTCYEANASGLSGILNNITEEISKINAGTEAILHDTIGNDFTFVSSSDTALHVTDKDITYDFGTLTESEKSFSYLVQLTLPQTTPFHDTNVNAKLNYVDYDGESQELSFRTSPQVYWLTKYDYTVNYYENEVDTENLLGSKTYNEVLNTAIDAVDETLFIPTGYIVKSISALPLTVTSDESENVINVVYEKNNKITYTVEYYYDNILDASKTATMNNQTYGNIITAYQDKSGTKYKLKGDNVPYTLGLTDNVIKVYYEKIIVEEDEIVPPKTGVEENEVSLLYAAPLLILFFKKRFF